MSYSIVFSGEIKASFTKDTVISNLSALFKKDASAIEKLFIGKKIIIKRDLDLENANKYLAALENTGAICELVDQSASTSNTTSSGTPGGTLSMAEVGATIIEQADTPQAQIDTSNLSMSAAGETIIDQVKVKPAIINDLTCDLLPTGSTLSDEQPAKPANIDISNLSLSDTGSNLDKD